MLRGSWHHFDLKASFFYPGASKPQSVFCSFYRKQYIKDVKSCIVQREKLMATIFISSVHLKDKNVWVKHTVTLTRHVSGHLLNTLLNQTFTKWAKRPWFIIYLQVVDKYCRRENCMTTVAMVTLVSLNNHRQTTRRHAYVYIKLHQPC